VSQLPSDELALYDLAVRRLHTALASRLPPTIDLPGTLTAYAYWVCTVVSKPGADWDQVLDKYINLALCDAVAEWESDCREEEALRRVLGQVRGPLLDIGAGWGCLAPLYEESDLQAVYLDPSTLGIHLMRRRGLDHLVCATGQRLPFASGAFLTTVIGWLLHHGPQGVDASLVLSEAARVCAPGGTLISIEPLHEGFTQQEWVELTTGAGFVVNDLVQFYEMPVHRGRLELRTMSICTRRGD